MRTVWMIELVSLTLIGSGILAQPGKPANGLRGEYFNGPNFEHKVFTRIDPEVDFNWNGQSPAPGVQHEYFSVRWTGKLYAPTSGKYRFSATVDDGVRVWVNGRKVIDEWRKQDDSRFVGEISLTGHQLYDLRIEYYNDWKGSVISVFWESPEDRRILSFTSSPNKVIPTKYLFSSASRPRPAPVTPPKREPLPKPVPVALNRPLPEPTAPTRPEPAVRNRAPDAVKPKKNRLAQQAVAPGPTDPAPMQAGFMPVLPAVAAPATPPAENLKINEPVVLRQVLFAQSEYVLLPESYAELNKLVAVLRANPNLQVEIAGHTDNVGDKRLNQALSEFRAKVVATYLIRQGVADTRITAKGYGGSRPIVDNQNEEQRAQNRRVEFVLNDRCCK